MELPFNRALHTDDYPALLPWSKIVLHFEQEMRSQGIPFRKDHEHRTWEYANVLRQIDLLFPATMHPRQRIRVLDAGGGGSSLSPLLAILGHSVVTADSMAYGDIEEAFTTPQRNALGIQQSMTVLKDPVEAMRSIPDNTFDVSMCISVIEHVDASKFINALDELRRVTKPGGYVFITTDFFESIEQADVSPFRSIQHTIFTPKFAAMLPKLAQMQFVEHGASGPWIATKSEYDLRFQGDFVHNYSFINFVLAKRP